MTFKPGDKVTFVRIGDNGYEGVFYPGKVYIVKNCFSDGGDEFVRIKGYDSYEPLTCRFKLIKEGRTRPLPV